MKNKGNLNKFSKDLKHTERSPKGQKMITLGLLGGIVVLSGMNVSCKRETQVQEDKKKLELVGFEFNQDGFFKAAAQDNLQALKIFKENKFDMTTKDLLGRTAAHAAAYTGAVRSLSFLHDNSIDLDSLDQKHITPLMLAVSMGKLEAIDYLLKAGVPTQTRDQYKKFALLYAVDGSSEEAIRLLAPHNRQLLDTALLYAADQNKPHSVEALVQYGASVYARNRGMTSLMIAAAKGHDKVVEELITHGANAFAVSDDGNLARDYANGNERVLTALNTANATTKAAGDIALEWSEEELEEVVKNAMERYHQSEVDEFNNQPATETPIAANSPDRKVTLPKIPKAPDTVKVKSIRGKMLPIKAASAAQLTSSLSMAAYAEKPLPLIINAEEPGSVKIRDLRSAEVTSVPVEIGSTIAMTGLKVKQIKKKIVNSKMTGGLDKELVTLMIEDENTGQTREIYSGYESTAADAVAVVKLNENGEHWLVRRGDTFTDFDGTLFKVGDVNEREVVVENTATGEVSLLPLLGIKHQ